LNASVAVWKKRFGVQPFQRGQEPEDQYQWFAFNVGNTRCEGDMTIEFLAFLNDPKGENLIGKFIKDRGRDYI
jgi:hypothetical protein